VQPVTLEERLAHIAAAQAKLDTRIPWLADSMDNDLKHAFGDRNNSEFVVSPEGKLVIARSWSDPGQMREDLAALVGESDTTTEIADLDRKPRETPKSENEHKIASGVVPRVERDKSASALVVTPVPTAAEGASAEKAAPLYVKLRAEAPRSLLDGGEGKLYLGFHLDPIYQMHWNNLAPALEYEITTAEGISIAQATGSGPSVESTDADRDPREFLIDVDFGDESPSAYPLTVQVNYFACDDAGTFCNAAGQTFKVEWRVDRDAGKVREMGASAGTGGRPGNASRPRPDPKQLIQRMDRDEDGKVSRAEARGPMQQRFDSLDADEDGFVTEAELKKGFESMRRR
jgi:hypothetical protein